MEQDMRRSHARMPGWLVAHGAARSEIYPLLAALLKPAPTEELLGILRNLQSEEALPERMGHALGTLRKAARDHSRAAVETEYNALFVGLGSGELAPYASWYREKRTQPAPLASLRSDLIGLGIVRQARCHEPEDHAGVLCEIMAILSRRPGGAARTAEERFFQRHVAPWLMIFFEDLRMAKNADFYRAVGSFGRCFLEIEHEYWNHHSHLQS